MEKPWTTYNCTKKAGKPEDADTYSIVGLHFYLVARREKSVKSRNEFRVALEQVGHTSDDSRRVNAGNRRIPREGILKMEKEHVI